MANLKSTNIKGRRTPNKTGKTIEEANKSDSKNGLESHFKRSPKKIIRGLITKSGRIKKIKKKKFKENFKDYDYILKHELLIDCPRRLRSRSRGSSVSVGTKRSRSRASVVSIGKNNQIRSRASSVNSVVNKRSQSRASVGVGNKRSRSRSSAVSVKINNQKRLRETPVNIRKSRETPVNIRKSRETPGNIRKSRETPVGIGRSRNTPVSVRRSRNTPVDPTRSRDTPVRTEINNQKRSRETPVRITNNNERKSQDLPNSIENNDSPIMTNGNSNKRKLIDTPISNGVSNQRISLDAPVSSGMNNNSFLVTNQNNTVPSEQGCIESPKKKKQKSDNNENGIKKTNIAGKTVSRKIFEESPDNVRKDKKIDSEVTKKASNRSVADNKATKKSSNMPISEGKKGTKKSKDNPNDKSLSSAKMDKATRQDVLSKMKSILSPDDDPNEIPSKNTKPNKVSKIIKKTNKAKIDSKTKQVRLSNGVVLTLSLLECDVCQKKFSNKASLTRHMFSHFDMRPFHCRHCLRKFRHKSTLKDHMQRKHFNTSKVVQFFVCHICDKTFQKEENYEIHLASHVKTENNFKCLFCDKKFSYRLLLLQHEKIHLETGRYKCFACEVSYDSRVRLSHHIKKHSKSKDYICQYCGKDFVRLNSIKRHVRVCHGGQRIQCPICNKDLKGHLTEHMRLHDKNKPHVCPECGLRFTQATQLKVHSRAHTGAKPYGCKICGHKFAHSNALMLHIRRHTGEKPFACAMCPMTFSQLPHMKTHMRKIHNKSGAYKCEKCIQFFKFKADLGNHMKTCTVGDQHCEDKESVVMGEVEIESIMTLSKMRFQLALLLTMIASKEKLKFLGFNKRLIDEILIESIAAMGQKPCNNEEYTPLKRLKTNIEKLMERTIPRDQMDKFRSENKSTEEILVMLTDEK